MSQSKAVLRLINIQVRAELNQPVITDVLLLNSVTKDEIANDILFVLKNSVVKNFNTICSNGRENS